MQLSRERMIAWQEWCFFTAVLFLPIQNSHWFSSLGFLFGNAERWSLFPLIAGMILGCFTQYKYRNFAVYGRSFYIYVMIFYILALFSLVWGMYIFPWWDADIFGKTKFLTKVFSFIATQQLFFSEDIVRKIWFFVRSLRELLTEFIYTFAIVYWIFCLFYKRCERAIFLTGKAICLDLLVMLPYAFVEICYLRGAVWAEAMLSTINPFLYDVASSHNWWPPLLWEKQMRNLFAEPSYLGAWFAIVMPILWYHLIFRKNKPVVGIIICFICYWIVFLTVARTALCLAIGEIILLLILSIWIWNKWIIVKAFEICLCFVLAFGVNLLFNSYKWNVSASSEKKISENYINIELSQNIKTYLDDNALSVASPTARSNQARYSNIFAYLKTGMLSPVLGVGSTLVKAYLPDNFSPESTSNPEIKTWITLQREQGFLSSSIPGSLCEYPVRFAEKGIMGLLIFLLPFGIAIYFLSYKIYTTRKTKQSALPLCLWIAFSGGCMLGFSISLNLVFGFWILFGMVICCGTECINTKTTF